MFSVHKDVLGRAMQGAYCRDERYAAVPGMAKSGDVHDYMDVVVRAKHGARAERAHGSKLVPDIC